MELSLRLRQHWFLFVLMALFVGLSVKYSFKVLQHRSAIIRWQPQLQTIDARAHLAHGYVHPCPPIMIILLEPLGYLPPLAAGLLWYYLKVGMVLLSLHWVFRLVETLEQPFPPWAKVLTVLLSLRPIMGDLDHGNNNLFILFLIVAALTAYRGKRDLFAGGLFGLAIACKVTPLLFVPYFLWKRSWRLLGGVAISLVLFFWPGLVPSLRLGWPENQRFFAKWYGDMVYPFVVEGRVWTDFNNQSLHGVLYRLTTHSPSDSIYVGDVYTPTRYDNWLALATVHVRWLLKGCLGLFGLAVMWSCRTPSQPRQGWRLAAEYSLIALGMLLFSERTWKHHCVTMVLPFAVLSYCLAVVVRRRSARAGLTATLATSAFLMASTSSGTRIWPNAWAEMTQIYGAYAAACLLLAAVLVVLLKRLAVSAMPGLSADSAPSAKAA